MSHPKELPIPPVARESSGAIEVARVWVAKKAQHVSLATGLWKDPAAWGVMLVDLAKHVANAYHETTGQGPSEALARIKEGFDAEWAAATDDPEGGLVDKE